MAPDPVVDYPLGQKRPDAVSTPSGLPLDDVTVEAMREGRLAWEDLRATPDTLRLQAEVAEAVERDSVADNLRAQPSSLTIPSDTILEIYTALRPHRSSRDQLEAGL